MKSINPAYVECADGDVRLTGGESLWEGRVEICQSNSYLRVCDDLWDEPEARVVCRQVNYTGPGELTSVFEFDHCWW